MSQAVRVSGARENSARLCCASTDGCLRIMMVVPINSRIRAAAAVVVGDGGRSGSILNSLM